jgi:hypothetical protein
VGYNRRVFFRCGIQQRRFSYAVGYNRRGFFPLWDTLENNLRMANKLCYTVLYPTMEDIFLRCGIQRKRFFFIVGYNGRSFPTLWDTTKEVYSIVGYNGRGFFPLWDTIEKKHTTQNDIFKF